VAPLGRDLRAVAWTKLGEGHLREGRWAQAASTCRHALADEPDLCLARYALGRALFEEGEFERAAALFRGLLGAPPDALGMTLHRRLAAVAVGLCHLRAGRFADAVQALIPDADGDTSGETAFLLGNAYLGLGRLADAVAAYREASAQGFIHPDLERRLALGERLALALDRPCLT